MFSTDRHAYRHAFITAWQKSLFAQPLEPVEQQIVEVVRAHPDYQALLNDRERALSQDYLPESGQANPFMHMSLHMALNDQLSIDRPKGIRARYQQVLKRLGDVHQAQHRLMDCLAEQLWLAQQPGANGLDEPGYMACIKRAARS